MNKIYAGYKFNIYFYFDKSTKTMSYTISILKI